MEDFEPTDIQTNLQFLEGRLVELSEQLAQSQTLVKTNPSPGLLASICFLEQKKQNVIDGLELWKAVRKVYPTYNR